MILSAFLLFYCCVCGNRHASTQDRARKSCLEASEGIWRLSSSIWQKEADGGPKCYENYVSETRQKG